MYITRSSTGVAGLTVGLYAFSTIATRYLAGSLSDRRGPKPAVLSGATLTGCAGLAYMLSSITMLPATAALSVLVVARLIHGFAESLLITGTTSWGIARIGQPRTGLVVSWSGIAIFAGLGIGAPIGLRLFAEEGFFAVAAATVVLGLLAGAIAAVVAGEAATSGRRLPALRLIGLIGRYGLALAFAAAPMTALNAFIALAYASREWNGAGLALTGFAAAYIGVRLLLPGLADRVGGARVALGSFAVQIVGQLALWLAPNPMIALLGAVITGAGFSLVFPALGVEAVKRVAPENRGLAVGGFMAFVDLSTGVTAPLAGLLAAAAGYGAVFLAGAVVTLAAFTITAGSMRRSSV